MGFEPFYGRGPQRLLWAGLRAAHGKIAIGVVPNRLNDSKIVIVHAQFTDVITSRIIQPGGPRVWRLML